MDLKEITEKIKNMSEKNSGKIESKFKFVLDDGCIYIDDTVNVCLLAWKKNLSRHYSISNKQSFSILEVAKMFRFKIKFLKKRPGERYASALAHMNLSNKLYKYFGKKKLKDYINEIIKD